MNALAETLTQGELQTDVVAAVFALSAPDDEPLPGTTRLSIAEQPMLRGCAWPETLGDEGRIVWLLLEGGDVVEGWMSRRFLGGQATFWTWDARFCRVSQFLPGVRPVVLPGCVEPIGWSEA